MFIIVFKYISNRGANIKISIRKVDQINNYKIVMNIINFKLIIIIKNSIQYILLNATHYKGKSN